MEQPKRKLKVVVMRHAESVYNKTQAEYAEHNGLHPKYEDLECRFLTIPGIVDAILTEKGIHQCQEASAHIVTKHPNLKYVAVSPMRRTLMTAENSLKNYPGKLEWTLLPWIREILMSQCDLGIHCLEHLKSMPYIDPSPLNNDPLWFLTYYVEDERKLAQEMREAYKNNPTELSLINVLKKYFPEFESPKQMYARIEKVKEWVRNFVAEKERNGIEVKDEELIIVAHSRILRYLFGVFTLDGEVIPEREVFFKNAETAVHEFDV